MPCKYQRHILTFYENNTLKLGIKKLNTIIDVLGISTGMNIENIPTTPKEFYTLGSKSIEQLKTILEQPSNIIKKYSKNEGEININITRNLF